MQFRTTTKEDFLKQGNDLKVSKAKEFLRETDFYFTIDKYETLTDEKKKDLISSRDEARKVINDLGV